MAHLHARQANDRKRNGGNFTPQGKHGRGSGKKTSQDGKRAHHNKYAEFSQADGAEERLRARQEADRRREEREARERRWRGW